MQQDKTLLKRAQSAWDGLGRFRSRRRRAKDFTFGRQWGDTMRLPSGRIVTEEAQLLESGRVPVSNNLIRQLIKSIVGRWRYLRKDESDLRILPVDARTLEEFLISGCASQRLGDGFFQQEEAVVVSPNRLFFTRFEQPDASDCRLLGMLHDVAPDRVLQLFARSNRRASEILATYQRCEERAPVEPLMPTETDFLRPTSDGTWRVIEVWQKESFPLAAIHDPEKAEYVEAEYTDALFEKLEKFNASRREKGERELNWRLGVETRWVVTFLTPKGDVLMRRRAKENERPPIRLTLYPMIDGEVHSFVDDLIEQQKYVNRLVMMLDEVMRASAKGVVMFPVDQLPEGLTWQDIRRLWSEPGAILPFKRTSRNVMPYQMNTAGTSAGASELLRIQMQMFDEISGTSSGTRGSRSSAAGAEMLREEFEQATVALYDLLAAFEAFLSSR